MTTNRPTPAETAAAFRVFDWIAEMRPVMDQRKRAAADKKKEGSGCLTKEQSASAQGEKNQERCCARRAKRRSKTIRP